MTPRTSVVIPCYNVQEYLPEALNSVKRQTTPVREIILIDDGSTVPIRRPDGWDGPPLQIIRTENRGLPAARNLGITHCSGTLIAFLDADDAWHERKIELQEQALAADPNAAAVYTHCVRQPGYFGFGPYPPQDVSDDEFLVVLWYYLFFPPSCVLVRRAALDKSGPFREDLGNGEDIELWLRLLTFGRFVQVPEPLCFYRQHANQFTKNVCKKILGSKQSRAAMIARHADRLVRAGIPRHKLWDAYRHDVLLVYFRREFRAARRLLWDYWREHPRDWKILAYSLVSWMPVKLVSLLRGRLPSAAGGELHEVLSPTASAQREFAQWDLAFARIRNALAG
jgi:glycosyltransferase involved in cell wall biosynthesis